MKVMITGSAGLLGKALLHTLPDNVDTLFLVYRNTIPEIPVFEKGLVVHYIRQDLKIPCHLYCKPDLVIHAAAEGAVDKIQQKPHLGLDCILDPTVNLIRSIKECGGCRMIYLSTNAVFNGEAAPYSDDAPHSPINSYGIFKAACELAVQGCGIPWNIARPLLMYGWPNPGQRSNWVPMWIDKLKKKEVCHVVYDVKYQPLYYKDCAEVVWKIANSGLDKQIFNIAGADSMSLYDFARIVAEEIGADKHLIEPVPSSHFKSLAPRPRDASYDLNKIKTVLKHTPMSVRDGLKDMLRVL